MPKKDLKKGEIIIYKSAKGPEIKVKLEVETVWLTQRQIAELFDIDRTVATKHIRNIIKEGELKENSVCAKFAHTAEDGKVYTVEFYNLDMVISVGYRVNSKRATDFRVWATKTLKSHLLRGYTINEQRLLQAENKFKELQEAVSFLREKSNHKLLFGQEKEIINLLADYSKTFSLLEKYDKEKLVVFKKGRSKFKLEYGNAKNVIIEVKTKLTKKKETGGLFGQEYGEKMKGIIGNIYQTFGRKELYPSLEEKAAHLLYFIVKDHPFADGNKRIGAFLFVYFLDKNNYLLKKSGERKINDNALTALAILVAVSDPKEKDKMIKITTNLLRT